ncbi:hypothetical protein P3S68_006938 [Capsicum galapagoense]
MDVVTVLLHHSGEWVSEIRYDNYRVDGIVIHEKISYRDLMDTISIQLKNDLSKKKIHAKYIVQYNSSTLEIHNDMTVKLFIEILKAEFIFEKYPLCITTSDFVIDSDVVDADDLMIECYDFVEPSGLAVAEVDSVESLEIGNVGGVELISDCYNSVVKVNQKYTNKATLVSVMRNYAIKHRFNFRAERSDKQSYVLLCKSPECSWVFKVSCKHGTDTFIVRTFNDEHTFSIMDRVFEQQHTTIAFVTGLTASKLVNYKRIITSSDIIEDIKREFDLNIDYMKAWRAKERALKILRGRPADGYKKLLAYIYMPVVVVDGSHMRGPYQETFVSASTLDGAGHRFPLAYGVVNSENDSSGTWFFQQFKCAFGERDNIKSKDKLTREFFAMAKAYKLDDFDELMGRMMTSNIAECINSRLVEARELPILEFLE